MSARRFLLALAPALALAACGSEADEPETVRASLEDEQAPFQGADESSSARSAGAAPEPVEGATPMAERVATLGLLNKRNNLTQDIELRPGETFEDGPVIITLAACERTPPWEMPRETGAFVQVDILERGQSEHRRVFSGWLFRESPSLNVVEHPIYDVWVKDCAMSFPGDE